MDAVYLFGGSDSGELRASLRSVANLRQVDRVAVSGAHPGWLAGEVLRVEPAPHKPGKHESTWANLRAACSDRRLSDEIVLMNDDFFVLREVDAIPVWHAGPLDGFRRGKQDKRLAATLAHVAQNVPFNAPPPLDYELHTPMVIHRHLMAALMAAVEASGGGPVWKRTLYGNVAHPGVGDRHDDVKLRDFGAVPGPADLFVSTGDYTWGRGAVGQWLRARFADPCRYERKG